MEQAPQNTKEDKEDKEDIQVQVRHILEFQDNFSSWVDKTNYIAFSYLEHIGGFEQSLDFFRTFDNYCIDFAHLTVINHENILLFEEKKREARNLLVAKYRELGLDQFTLWFLASSRQLQVEIREKTPDDFQESIVGYFGSVSLDKDNAIHFDKFHEQGSGEIDIPKSFSQIFDFYFEKGVFPESIKAHSWLMGRDSLRQVLGFEKVAEEDFAINQMNPGILGQCIDGLGNIKPKVLEYLFENHELPYKFTEAQISIEEFIKKYVSEKYQGVEISIEDTSKISVIEKDITSLQEEFKEYFKENIKIITIDDLKKEIIKNPVWQIFQYEPEGDNFFIIMKKIISNIQDNKMELGHAMDMFGDDLDKIKIAFKKTYDTYLSRYKVKRKYEIPFYGKG